MIDLRWGLVLLGDCRDLGQQVADKSVDLIFTDPPYPKEYLYLYEWLFPFAARVLKPDGFLLCYEGGTYKDDIMAMARKHLSYFWEFWESAGDYGSPVIWARRVLARGKSILSYRKLRSDVLPRTNVLGMWVGGGPDKRYHAWGQGEQAARYYIDCFSNVGDLVLDPFCGGGTVPAVCQVLERKWLAFDIDPVAIEATTQHIADVNQPYQRINSSVVQGKFADDEATQ